MSVGKFMPSRDSCSSHHVLLATICLAAVLSVLISACSRPEPEPHNVPSDAVSLFQERSIGQFGLRQTRKVALTFDDGPSAKTTSELLDLLKSEGVHASFFVVGKNARRNPELLARMRREGHVLGNHSHTHANLALSLYVEQPERVVSEIKSTHSAIAPYLAGQRRPYFRAPYGAWRPEHASSLNERPELRAYVGPILWTAGSAIRFDSSGVIRDAADWECWQQKERVTVSQCADGYMNAIESYRGGVALMHDIFSGTLALTAEVIRRLKAAGYQFVTLDEIESLDRFQ